MYEIPPYLMRFGEIRCTCIFNTCHSIDSCGHCGFNLDVAEARKARIHEEGLTEDDRGLLTYHIREEVIRHG